MIPYYIIAVCIGVGLFGIFAMLWSIKRDHERLATQARAHADRVAGVISIGGRMRAHHRPPPPRSDIPDRIDVLRPKPGDVLAIQVCHAITEQQRDAIYRKFWPHAPHGVNLVVLGAGESLAHARLAEPAATRNHDVSHGGID